MYYNVVLPDCLPLFAGVAFKQQARQYAQTPGLEQGDLFETKQGRHEPVPEQHHRHCTEQADGYD